MPIAREPKENCVANFFKNILIKMYLKQTPQYNSTPKANDVIQ